MRYILIPWMLALTGTALAQGMDVEEISISVDRSRKAGIPPSPTYSLDIGVAGAGITGATVVTPTSKVLNLTQTNDGWIVSIGGFPSLCDIKNDPNLGFGNYTFTIQGVGKTETARVSYDPGCTDPHTGFPEMAMPADGDFHVSPNTVFAWNTTGGSPPDFGWGFEIYPTAGAGVSHDETLLNPLQTSWLPSVPLSPDTDYTWWLTAISVLPGGAQVLKTSPSDDEFTYFPGFETIDETTFRTGAAITPPVCQQSVLTWGGAGEDWAVMFGRNAAGDRFAAGISDSFGSTQDPDVLLMTFDANLVPMAWVWSRTGNDYVEGRCFDPGTGHAFLSGTTAGASSDDLLLIRYDPLSGVVQWAQSWALSAPDVEHADSVSIHPGTGNLVLGGGNRPGGGLSDALFAEFDQSGNPIQAWTWGGTGDESFNGTAVNQVTGDIYLVGQTDSPTLSAGNYDVLVMQLDATGSLIRARTWGGVGNDDAYGVHLDNATGDVYVLGATTTYSSGGDRDAFLLKLSSSLNLIWDVTWGGSREDGADGLVIDTAGDLLVSGDTQSGGAGGEDEFVVKLRLNDPAPPQLLWGVTWGGSQDDRAGLSYLEGNLLLGSAGTQSSGHLLLDWPVTLSLAAGSLVDRSATPTPATGTTQVLGTTTSSVSATCGGGSDVVLAVLDLTGNCTGTILCPGVGCPCANDDQGAGCANSKGSGAALRGSGSTSVAADDLHLSVAHVPPNANGILFMGSGVKNVPFGAGRLCVGGTVRRFPFQNGGTCGDMHEGPGIAALQGIVAGQTWNFQGWYRDPNGPCSTSGLTFNLSNAYQVTFTP